MPLDKNKPSTSKKKFKEAYANIFDEIIDDLVLEITFQLHRAVSLSYFPIEQHAFNDDGVLVPQDPDKVRPPSDKLSNPANSKKPSHILCPHCKRKLGTNRFAPHLNSCMGEGRQTKERNAKRACQIFESGDDDDDEDYSDSTKKKKKRPAKNTKRGPKNKGKPVDTAVFLTQKCGVLSRKSKTMCQNSLKCSIHTEEQRKEIRRTLLKPEPEPNVHVDVDTVDEVSRSPSPSDFSVDSNNSALSIKVEDIACARVKTLDHF